VIALERCLGPMLPAEEFDAPEALRRDFDLLCSTGAPADRFGGLPELALERTASTPGERARATLRVPESADFFADHFPRRPVFPATLLLDTQIRLALALARETLAPGAETELAAARILDVKVRSFIPPGEVLELDALRTESTADTFTARLVAKANGKTVATARVEIDARRSAPA
jgi:3-hydroxymyristoyl/3-hydroxydecanoyl-(acyl carrier protein) dehydratase